MLRQLSKTIIPKRLFRAIEPYGHLFESILANILTGFPARGLKVIGVTGTDGKTTTSTLIATMLRQAGLRVGMMTTVAIDTGSGPRPNPTRLTTVTALQLLQTIRQMKREGVEWLVLETTSHALAQHRVWGIPYSVAVMTNVTHEHLDYHRTFARYRGAKLLLFRKAAANRKGLRLGIVNTDDPAAELFIQAVPQALTYGLTSGDLVALDVRSDAAGNRFRVEYRDRAINIISHLPGEFNVSNALAAVGVGVALGLTTAQIEQGIAAVGSVEGRMNTISAGQDFAVIVDYAHTPGSFEKILPAMRTLTKGRLIAVFGSAGRRDEAKRPILGELAGQFCDVVIVTEEDDRDQDGQAIMEEIAAGADRVGKVRGQDLHLIHDRSEAINLAIGQARAGDTVLLLGKGHETSMLSNAGKVPWNEAAVARTAILEKLK